MAAGMRRAFWFMRHSEREDDQDESFFDRLPTAQNCDVPITRRGIRLAERAAQVLAASEDCPTAIVCSPYLRCAQTALIVASVLKVPRVVVDVELREYFFRRKQAQPEFPSFDPAQCLWRDLLAPGILDWSLFDRQVRERERPLVESVSEAYERTSGLLKTLDTIGGSPRVLAVTHGYCVQMLTEGMPGADDVTGVDYTALTHVVDDGTGSFRAVRVSDSRHVDGVSSDDAPHPTEFGMESLHPWPADQGPRKPRA